MLARVGPGYATYTLCNIQERAWISSRMSAIILARVPSSPPSFLPPQNEFYSFLISFIFNCVP